MSRKIPNLVWLFIGVCVSSGLMDSFESQETSILFHICCQGPDEPF